MTNLSIRLHMAAASLLSSLTTRERRGEGGQDLIEYAMLGALIAAGIVAVLALFGTQVTNMITNIGKCIDFDSGTVCAPGF